MQQEIVGKGKTHTYGISGVMECDTIIPNIGEQLGKPSVASHVWASVINLAKNTVNKIIWYKKWCVTDIKVGV